MGDERGVSDGEISRLANAVEGLRSEVYSWRQQTLVEFGAIKTEHRGVMERHAAHVRETDRRFADLVGDIGRAHKKAEKALDRGQGGGSSLTRDSLLVTGAGSVGAALLWLKELFGIGSN